VELRRLSDSGRGVGRSLSQERATSKSASRLFTVRSTSSATASSSAVVFFLGPRLRFAGCEVATGGSATGLS
jgi:hypothetical protein